MSKGFLLNAEQKMIIDESKQHKDSKVSNIKWNERVTHSNSNIIDVGENGLLDKKSIQKLNRYQYLNISYEITEEAEKQYDVFKYANRMIKLYMSKEAKDYKNYYVNNILEANDKFYTFSIMRKVKNNENSRWIWEFYDDVVYKLFENGTHTIEPIASNEE